MLLVLVPLNKEINKGFKGSMPGTRGRDQYTFSPLSLRGPVLGNDNSVENQDS